MRNESIIGEIVACPQCGSMVHIIPPGETEPPVPIAPSAASPVVTPTTTSPVETPTPQPPPEEAELVEAMETTSGLNWIAWTAGILAVGATLFGAAHFWSAEPESSAAALPASKKPIENSAEVPAVVETATTTVESVEPEPTSEKLPSQPKSKPKQAVAKPAAPAQTAPPPTPEPPPPVPLVARRYDPLDLEPEGLDLTALDELETQESATESEESDGVEPPTEDFEPVASTLPVARRGSDPEWDVAASDAKQQLAKRLPSLQFRGLRLIDFLTLVAQLSGSPVSVSAEQLQMAGISPRKRVSLNVTDITLDEALTQVLDPLRLEFALDGPQVIVRRKGASQVREIEYPIDDLASDDAEAKQLANWVRRLVVPASWQEGSLTIDGESFRISQSQQVHYQVLVFLERLRLVRNLPTRSRYPVERLVPTPLQAAMAGRLSAPALFTFSRETSFTEVLLHWQRELDLPLLVDWPTLAEAELWPESTIVCAVADEPWDKALSKVLEPLDLDWRPACGGAIEISSVKRFEADQQLELYRLTSKQPLDREKLALNLQKHLDRVFPTGARESVSSLIVDPEGPAVLALQPATAHRAILSWLIEQKLFHQP